MRAVSRWALVVLATLVAAAGASAQQARELTMGLASTSFATVVPRIAQEMGLYAKYGLEPKFTVMDNASGATTALISKSVESANSGPGEVVVAQARGQKVVVVANTYAGMSGTLVLAKYVADKLGVAANAPVSSRLKALDGLIIASPSATGVYTISLKNAAAAAGASVRFTYMALSAMPAALDSGAVQGFIAGAPFWAVPIVKGNGVMWISGPKGDLPAEFVPVSSSNLQMMRAFAEANPAVAKSLASIVGDVAKAVDERPADVKAAVAKLYPNVDAATLDLLFAAESVAWKVKPVTPKDMAHEIAYVKKVGVPLPQIDSVNPASMIFP